MRNLALLAAFFAAAIANANSLSVREVLRDYSAGKAVSKSELKKPWRQVAQLYVTEEEAVLYVLPDAAAGRTIASEHKATGSCRQSSNRAQPERMICHDRSRDNYYVYEAGE